MPDTIAAIIAKYLADCYSGITVDKEQNEGFIASRLPLYFCTAILKDDHCCIESWVNGQTAPDPTLYYYDTNLFTNLDTAITHCRHLAEEKFGSHTSDLAKALREAYPSSLP